MYTPAEQQAWRHAFDTVRPRAVWLPHYPFPLARLLPAHRRMLTYVTVHDTLADATTADERRELIGRTLRGLRAI